MSFFANKKKRNIFIVCTSVDLIILTLLIVMLVYLNTYYKADNQAISAFNPIDSVEKITLDKNTLVYKGHTVNCGFIFYPGGKVEYTAYEPLMKQLTSLGIMSVLIKMPFNLAVFNMNGADGIQEQFADVTEWYIGGHSLGGAMSASYIAKHIDEYSGLVLLGAYSTADLSDTSLKVISIYGSEDKVLNEEKYDKNKVNLPQQFEERIIDGGCHAYFGMYGSQKGDGQPTITNSEQILITAQYISQFVGA